MTPRNLNEYRRGAVLMLARYDGAGQIGANEVLGGDWTQGVVMPELPKHGKLDGGTAAVPRAVLNPMASAGACT